MGIRRSSNYPRGRRAGRSGRTWGILLGLGLLVGIVVGVLVLRPKENSTATPPPVEGSFISSNATPRPSEDLPTLTAVATSSFVTAQATSTDVFSVNTIYIPKLSLTSPIINTFLADGSWDVSLIGRHVGHLQGTAELGESGNVVLAAHVELRTGEAGAFRKVEDLAVGDEIVVVSGTLSRQYRITEIYKTEPSNLDPVMPTSDNRLTLITCSDYDFLSNSYQQRVVIVATESTAS
jgi:LPXTG-site transpeptidase (sortase) family protein